MNVVVIDAGTSSVRAAVIGPNGTVLAERAAPTLPDVPVPGLVEFDADHYGDTALRLAREVMAAAEAAGHDRAVGVGVCNQRGSCVVWDPATGRTVAPAQGWQDLRTIGDCLTFAADGWYFAPNQTATKARNILDSVDPDRSRGLLVGTPDTWLVWLLSEGSAHVTDPGNAGISGMCNLDARGWNDELCAAISVPVEALPRIVDSVGACGAATALPGAPPIVAIAGDQQASLAGQGAVVPGSGKATFGTGAMLDLCLGDRPPDTLRLRGNRSDTGGTFPLVCWREQHGTTFGLEAIMLSAGTNVQWLRDDLGLIDSEAASAEVAATVPHTDGVVYVPAQLGLGTPQWDYGARSTLSGMSRGTTAAHVVRAVLEGVAQRGADLLDAAELDSGLRLSTLRIDGGMSRNPVFVQALADAIGRPVEVSPHKEATAVGAAALAHLALGEYSNWSDVAAAYAPGEVVTPTEGVDRVALRARWSAAVAAAGGWHPELSALDF
jgi:glycerol kinase